MSGSRRRRSSNKFRSRAETIRGATALQSSHAHITVAADTDNAISDHFDLLKVLHESACSQNAWTSFERALATRLHCIEATFRVEAHASSRAQAQWCNSQRRRPESVEARRTRLAADHVFADIPEGVPLTLADLMSFWGRSERCKSVEQWLADPRNPFVLGMDLDGNGHFKARLRIYRARTQGDFTAQDKALIKQLKPHLQTAAENHHRFSKALAERAFAGQLLPAVVFLDSSGTVMQVSDTAYRLLGKERAVTLDGRTLRFARADDAAAFQRILNRLRTSMIENADAVRPEAMSIRRASQQSPLWLVARPIRSQALGFDEYYIAIVIYADDTDEIDVPIEALQRLLGLTRTETTVALHLARGKTVKEVAEEFGVSLSTTRTHLRSIFAKTSIDKQTKLVRTVLQGIAMLSCR